MNGLPWNLWARQTFAVLRLEMKKGFFTRRAAWLYLLAFAPIFLTGGHWLFASRGNWTRHPLRDDSMVFAGIFQFYFLRLGIFFGCVAVFSNLFRGEVLEKTLHYYFLAPVRREILTLGKFLAGCVATLTVFGGSVVLSYIMIHLHYGAAFQEFLFRGPGLAQLGWYLLITVLACLGYGSVFLVMGLWLKNPMIAAAVVMIWEGMNPFLPSLLKKISVISYLKSLCPLEVPMSGPLSLIEVLAEPTPAYLAIPGLLIVAGMALVFAALQARKFQISYSE